MLIEFSYKIIMVFGVYNLFSELAYIDSETDIHSELSSDNVYNLY